MLILKRNIYNFPLKKYFSTYGRRVNLSRQKLSRLVDIHLEVQNFPH